MPDEGRVRVVLCTRRGRVLGMLPDLRLTVPWLNSTVEVVAGVRAVHGLDVTVLRLLDPHDVAYLCEIDEAPAQDLAPAPADLAEALADQPLRQRWADPGGPDELLAWADGVLTARGTPRTGAPVQVRAWNLSGIWRLPTTAGDVWLKAVPPFFAHEGAVLELVAQVSRAVPTILGHAPGRVLLADVPGQDLYGADATTITAGVRELVAIQAALAPRAQEVLAAGAFDWRPAAFDALAADVVGRTAGLSRDDGRVLDDLVAGLPVRHAAIAACGLPDTLVHGDFHPGNLRGDGRTLVLLDWGDSGVGQPLLDQAAALERCPQDGRDAVRAAWSAQWRRLVPGCDPDRAARLLEPVAALRQAVIYRLFLDRIEPTERHFHADDPAIWLRRAAQVARPAGPL